MKRHFLLLSACVALVGPASVLAQSSSGAPAGTAGAARVPPVNYADPMARLLEAADRLREAIQAMGQQPAGPRRNQAIEEAQQAFTETQAAMMMLPPELRTGAGSGAQPNYTKSMERLQQAAQKLREAVQAMAQYPAGEQRNRAADEAREALFETQQAMITLPADLRTGRSAAGGSGTDARWERKSERTLDERSRPYQGSAK